MSYFCVHVYIDRGRKKCIQMIALLFITGYALNGNYTISTGTPVAKYTYTNCPQCIGYHSSFDYFLGNRNVLPAFHVIINLFGNAIKASFQLNVFHMTSTRLDRGRLNLKHIAQISASYYHKIGTITVAITSLSLFRKISKILKKKTQIY